ncbi:TetR/AcrR family transcriptional regulator [Kitasatospora sp. NPDC058201]|uniref:TetR/AcrR family transcriptional regulator n=1 Tax=unclassified Kitasatospora TaxID=2633591 RepID=UPI00364717D8
MPSIRTVNGREIGNRGHPRKRILKATSAVLAEVGYADVQVINLARAARTSPATVYVYFPSRDAVVLELAQAAAEDFAKAVQAPAGGSTPDGTALSDAIDAYFERWRAHAHILRVVELMAATNPAFREVRDTVNKPLTDIITRAAMTVPAPDLVAALVAMAQATAARKPTAKARRTVQRLVVETIVA